MKINKDKLICLQLYHLSTADSFYKHMYLCDGEYTTLYVENLERIINSGKSLGNILKEYASDEFKNALVDYIENNIFKDKC
ncbi:MAG: hypothetical protein RSE41_07350 [Clostridia bacterium]